MDFKQMAREIKIFCCWYNKKPRAEYIIGIFYFRNTGSESYPKKKVREVAKFFVARPLMGGGGKGRPKKEKNNFFFKLEKNPKKMWGGEGLGCDFP